MTMKNIVKKISAFAMAFTLLGAGGSIASNVKNTETFTLTVSAATVDRNTPHNHGQFTYVHHYRTEGCRVYRVYYCSACENYNNEVFDHYQHGPTVRRQIRAGYYSYSGRKRVWNPPVYGLFCARCGARVG